VVGARGAVFEAASPNGIKGYLGREGGVRADRMKRKRRRGLVFLLHTFLVWNSRWPYPTSRFAGGPVNDDERECAS